jgi:hypothetical protein
MVILIAMKYYRPVFTLAAVTLCGACSLETKALSYSAADNGLSFPAGGTFTPTGGSFSFKTVAGFTGLGVSSLTAGEIDIGESISITFTSQQVFNQLTLGFLFDGPEFGDLKEIAAVRINGTTEYKLTAMGATTASWTGSGSVLNLSPATDGGAGVWSVTNPFGDIAIKKLELYPLSSNPGGNESDFSLISLNTRNVPEGGSTLGLFGLALSALAIYQKRAKLARATI